LDGRSTSATNVLRRFRDPPQFVTELLEYRAAQKLMSTYIKGMNKHLDPYDRVHTSFNLHVTATGRLSSSAPNLQNIPRGNKDIKNIMVPDEGNLWISADYSQIELRVMAILSQDPYLLECYKNGKDLHRAMGAELFRIPEEQVTSEQRAIAKGLNFGIPYGRSEHGILKDGKLPVGREEAIQLIRNFFARVAGVVKWIDSVKRDVRKTGYVETLFGRRRYFPEVEFIQRSYELDRVYREAVSTHPQSTASDMTLYALIKLSEMGHDVRLTVHDSIETQAPIDVARDVALEQARIMEKCAAEMIGDQIPFVASCEIGESYGSVKEVM